MLLLACGGGDSPGTGPSGGGVVSVQVSGAATVNVGSTIALSASPRDRNGSVLGGTPVSWSSSSPSVASVSSTGVVSGVAVGSAVITASAGGASGTATVTVTPDDTPASITLTPAGPLALTGGATATLSSTVRASDGHVVASAPVTLSSSEPLVATVTAGGVVTAGRTGTATITATSGPASASLTVTVTVGAAAQLFLRNSPGGTAGAPLTTQPVVEVRDKGGNLVPSAANPVTVSIASGGGSLTGTTTVNAVNGIATFTDLAIAGVAGTRTLAFASPGLVSASSADVVIAAATTPVLAMDTTSLALTLISGRSQLVSIGIRNGGAGTLSGVSVDAPAYDPGQAGGWLGATIAGSTTAPTTLTLFVSALTLAPGSYRATVKVNGANATNTPLTVTVAITVINGTFITYGSATEKLRIIDVGSSYTPALSARDGQGQVVPTGNVSYASRATSVATVDAQGRVSAVGEGTTWVVAAGTTSADSVFVIVPVNAAGPVLRSDVTTTVGTAGTAMTVNIYLDSRSTSVGAVSVAVGYTTAQSVFGSVSWTFAAGVVGASVNSGVIRASAAAANALPVQVPLLQLRLTPIRTNSSGTITLTVTEIVAPDGANLLPITTSTRIPVVVP